MRVKLSEEKLRIMSLFEKLTGVTPRDFVRSGDAPRLTFVVDEGDMGKAIGKNGENIKKIREKLDEKVNLVEYSSDSKSFLENIFSSAEIQDIKFEGREEGKTAVVKVRDSERGKVVGRNGWNIERARKLISRHHGVKDVSLA